jgi:predicted ATP-dependent Lon-type protease
MEVKPATPSSQGLINYQVQIPFASEKYAETAMRTIGVEPAFSDSKTKRTSITRKMEV